MSDQSTKATNQTAQVTEQKLLQAVNTLLELCHSDEPHTPLQRVVNQLRAELVASEIALLDDLQFRLQRWIQRPRKRRSTALFAAQTRFQHVAIYEYEVNGETTRKLFIDKHGQSLTTDEHIYHEMLAHPALLVHPDPQSVFIAGGGELATAREALRHHSVRRVVNAEIDQALTEACIEHLPSMSAGAHQDERLHMVYADAREVLEQAEKPFDVILIDVNDPVYNTPSAGEGLTLFSEEFLRMARSKLRSGGIFVTQSCAVSRPSFPSIVKTLQGVFAQVYTLFAIVPSYDVQPWTWTIAHDDDPSLHSFATLSAAEIDARITQRLGRPLAFLDGSSFRRSLVTPPGVAEQIASHTRTFKIGT